MKVKTHRRNPKTRSTLVEQCRIVDVVCPICKKSKQSVFYEVKHRTWVKERFTVTMCRSCLEDYEIKFKDAKELNAKKTFKVVQTILNILKDMESQNVSVYFKN